MSLCLCVCVCACVRVCVQTYRLPHSLLGEIRVYSESLIYHTASYLRIKYQLLIVLQKVHNL